MKKMSTKKTAKENATIDNTIMAMDNMEIDTPTSSWLTPSQTQAFKALERSTEDDSFLHLNFFLSRFRTVFSNFNMILNFQMLPDMHLTPLLNTSWLFNTEVNKEFKKVELQKYSRGVKSKLYKALHDENYSPPDYFWDRCRRNIFHERGSGYRSLSHVYIRPETDTLIIDYRQLFILYFVGGSIDLSNVKHIALANMHLDTEEVIFDVNDELYYQDFEFEDGTLHNERPHSLMQAKAEVDDCFRGFLRQLGSGFRLKDDVMNFWKVHVPGVGMIARFDADADWRLQMELLSAEIFKGNMALRASQMAERRDSYERTRQGGGGGGGSSLNGLVLGSIDSSGGSDNWFST
ncbi:uncharacterized protein EAF02_009860 [Botrytis sinoallii]|uniref:uncharacterized protein n=1 Tax=Botrytis sinoallii TaxID=1463999 RepID=UPI0018FFDBA1|nr:uncharacterized protein EAF02_009860 [Botrytis sinoallii]KAF7867074.1 hypothetical protein EAF02_009860 [Botrytis sinoallii]